MGGADDDFTMRVRSWAAFFGLLVASVLAAVVVIVWLRTPTSPVVPGRLPTLIRNVTIILLLCKGLLSIRTEGVKPAFRRLFREVGLRLGRRAH